MKVLAVFLLILCSLCFMDAGCRTSAGAGAGSDPADLLPLDNDISGFLRKGNAAVMTDEGSIYAAIDGNAKKYIDYGFIDGVIQKFSNGSLDIEVWIFNQGSSANAQDVYRFFYPPSPEVLSSGALQVVVDYSLPVSYSLFYQYHHVFMQINTTEKSDFALNMAKQFYMNIHAKISAGNTE
jgi:hypothetical protein